MDDDDQFPLEDKRIVKKKHIGKIRDYFLKNSDFETVADAHAEMMVDVYKLSNTNLITEGERLRTLAKMGSISIWLEELVKSNFRSVGGCLPPPGEFLDKGKEDTNG